jgi:hypothetical protein
MVMEINSLAPSVANTAAENIQQRQEYSSALSAALKNGNLGAAQEAILGLKGAGGLSPASLFSKIEEAVKSGDLEDAKKSLAQLQNFGKNSHASGSRHDDSIPEMTHAALPGVGRLVNIMV